MYFQIPWYSNNLKRICLEKKQNKNVKASINVHPAQVVGVSQCCTSADVTWARASSS